MGTVPAAGPAGPGGLATASGDRSYQYEVRNLTKRWTSCIIRGNMFEYGEVRNEDNAFGDIRWGWYFSCGSVLKRSVNKTSDCLHGEILGPVDLFERVGTYTSNPVNDRALCESPS